MECKVEESGSVAEAGPNCGDWSAESSGDRKIGNPPGLVSERRKHRHSVSMDGSSMTSSAHLRGGEGVFGEAIEAKKAMSSEQLAELEAVDPKRAKRYLSSLLNESWHLSLHGNPVLDSKCYSVHFIISHYQNGDSLAGDE